MGHFFVNLNTNRLLFKPLTAEYVALLKYSIFCFTRLQQLYFQLLVCYTPVSILEFFVHENVPSLVDSFLVQQSSLIQYIFTCLERWGSTRSHAVDLEELSWPAAADDIESEPSGALDQVCVHRKPPEILGLVCEPWSETKGMRRWRLRLRKSRKSKTYQRKRGGVMHLFLMCLND